MSAVPFSIAPGAYAFSSLTCAGVSPACLSACLPFVDVTAASNGFTANFSANPDAPVFPTDCTTATTCSGVFTLPTASNFSTSDNKVFTSKTSTQSVMPDGKGFNGTAAYAHAGNPAVACKFTAKLRCSAGSYKCDDSNANGFMQCDNGFYVSQTCALGSSCDPKTIGTQKSCTATTTPGGGTSPSTNGTGSHGSETAVLGGKCMYGDYTCSGSAAFLQCSNGVWIRQSCAVGTVCDNVSIKTRGCSTPQGSKFNYGDENYCPVEKSVCAVKDTKCFGYNSYSQCGDNLLWTAQTCGNGTYCSTSSSTGAPGCSADYNMNSCPIGAYTCDVASTGSFSHCSNSAWVSQACTSGYTCNNAWISKSGCTNNYGYYADGTDAKYPGDGYVGLPGGPGPNGGVFANVTITNTTATSTASNNYASTVAGSATASTNAAAPTRVVVSGARFSISACNAVVAAFVMIAFI